MGCTGIFPGRQSGRQGRFRLCRGGIDASLVWRSITPDGRWRKTLCRQACRVLTIWSRWRSWLAVCRLGFLLLRVLPASLFWCQRRSQTATVRSRPISNSGRSMVLGMFWRRSKGRRVLEGREGWSDVVGSAGVARVFAHAYPACLHVVKSLDHVKCRE